MLAVHRQDLGSVARGEVHEQFAGEDERLLVREREALACAQRGHAVRLVEALAAGQGAEVIAAVDGLRSLGLSATGTLEEMAALLQQMAVLQAVPDALDESDPDAPTAARLSGLLAPDETQFATS